MRKSLLLAAIAAAFSTPAAFAQVGVNLGGGAGIGVQAGPVGVGSRSQVDSGFATGITQPRLDTRANARADAKAQLPAVDVAHQAGAATDTVGALGAQAGAITRASARTAGQASGAITAEVREEARVGAQATTHASARAVEAVNANANAAANSVLGVARQSATTASG